MASQTPDLTGAGADVGLTGETEVPTVFRKAGEATPGS